MTEPTLGDSVVNYWRNRAQRLEADIIDLRVQLIVARNPGIDPDEVRATLPPWRPAAGSATPDQENDDD